MRIHLMTLLLMFFIAVSALAQQNFYVQPNNNNVGIYQNVVRGTNERAIQTVGSDDRLLVISEERNSYQVRHGNLTGWVEKRLVSRATGRAFAFDAVEVQGYMDNPTPFYITDADRAMGDPVDIPKSFMENLQKNADKEIALRHNHR